MTGLRDAIAILLFIVCSSAVVSSRSLQGGAGEDTTRDGIIVLRFGGDCLLADHYERDSPDSTGPAFAGFDAFDGADIAMVNLECPVTVRGERVEKPFTFRMHPRFLPALQLAGIDIVNIANNHIFDFGPVGLFDTIQYLDSLEIGHVGAGRNEAEAHTAVIKTVRGKRVGFLGYYGGGEAPAANGRKPGVADRKLYYIKKDIARLRAKEHADYVIVNFHWGTEKAVSPDPGQVAFAHAIVDAGADAIVGHHPHVLQGIERYGRAVIAYSIGNLIFGGNSRSSYDTAILELRLGGTETGCALLPVRVTNWHAAMLEGAPADSVIMSVATLSDMFSETVFNRKERE